jgi:hypothetical protein
MAKTNRLKTRRRQNRKRKAARAKISLYEQKKLTHDKLPSLAKRLLSRKGRTAKSSA